MRLRTCCVLLCWINAAVAGTCLADEPFGVPLMRPDSLAGWVHASPPEGWTISAGRLSGTTAATPLLSGFSFGDFELRLQWSTTASGQWKLLFPDVPQGDGLCLLLGEGEQCGRLTDGPKELAAGGKVGATATGMHAAAIIHSAGKFSLAVDGRRLYEVDLGGGRRFGLGLAVAAGQAELAGLRVLEPAGTPIFNGKDLTGWWSPGSALDDWKAENGELVLHPALHNYIRTEKLYGNYTLTCQYRMLPGDNSGIGIRTPREGWPSGDGMELQLLGEPPDAPINKSSTMAIYGNVPPLARTDHYPDWNRVVVKADGWMISAWVNGELVQQCNTLDHPELKHRHLKGWIGFQDHNGHPHFRDLRVLEAPDGPGLDAWCQPKPPRATAAVVDRLMNPDRLSMAEPIASSIVVKKVLAPASGAKKKGKSKREDVVAQLTGPGAIVRIAQLPFDGRLAFYFDGETQPRVECKTVDLRKFLPAFSDDSEPLLTCVTYKHSLKVVLRGATRSAVRLDCLQFPAEYALASFVDRESGFPRGWLSSTSYRHGQGAWGGLREFDSDPRETSPQASLRPGATAPLVAIHGTGIVQWVKLTADKKVLDDTDLWLQAVVDGKPAISAPARFWFPHLAGQPKTDSFVMTDHQGSTIRLAMPYAEEIRIEAVNRGDHTIRGVAVMVSYEQATQQNRQEIAGRMRLHGIYQPPSQSTRELIRQEGCGRWVGWVVEQPSGAPLGIDSLVVDEKPLADWAAANCDLMLGRGGEFRTCLSGRHGNLAWRYLWLAPVEFQRSLLLTANTDQLGGRLALFYLKK